LGKIENFTSYNIKLRLWFLLFTQIKRSCKTKEFFYIQNHDQKNQYGKSEMTNKQMFEKKKGTRAEHPVNNHD